MDEYLQISNKNIIVTGVSGEIGGAIAIGAKLHGLNVIGFDIVEPNKDILASLDFFYCGDVCIQQDIEIFKSQILGKFEIDAVVCCAGIIGEITDAENINFDKFTACINSSVLGTMLFVKNFSSVFKKKKKGNFILLSSFAALRGTALMPAYVASKYAINGLMKSFARELGPWGIRVNSILPGLIDSNMARSIFYQLKSRLNVKIDVSDQDLIDSEFIRSIPLGRLGQGKDINNLVMFLISDASSYIHGSMISIDGGLQVK